MNQDFTVNLYQTIKDSDVQREYKNWHCSALAQCPRAQYFSRLGVPRQRSMSGPQVLRRSAGHHVETAIREHIKTLLPNITSNQRFTSDGMDLTGEYDNFDPDTGLIVEIKSIHDWAFKEVDGKLWLKEQDGFHPDGRKKWVAKPEPHLHHEIQQHGLVKLMREDGLEVNGIRYIYVSLSGLIATYDTNVKQDILKNVSNRLEVLHEAWEKQEAPVCICKEEHELWGGVLQFCDYRREEDCCNKELLKEVK